ncbi:MAG: hypothetical protein IIZ98_00270 [Erysipelotrichaceae bacterium]|nr:hypothetical protein [Erysipelotrichaceae bacterium]
MITVGLAAFAKPNNSTRIAAASNFTNYSGVLVEPCSIMKPLIKFEGVQVWNYNYAYISQFSRYYFIDDYYTENGFWYAQMTVDVLASFKTSIGSSNQFVERAANKQDEYLIDQFYPTSGDFSFSEVVFHEEDDMVAGLKNGIFAINVTGSTEDIVSTYMCNYDTFCVFVTKLWAYASDTSIWTNLGKGLVNSFYKPAEHIGSVYWFPNDDAIEGWDDFDVKYKLHIGDWEVVVPDPATQKFYEVNSWVGGFPETVTLPKHPQAASFGKYMNCEPFSRYIYSNSIYGNIQLNASMLIDSTTASVRRYTDPMTGAQLLILPDGQRRMGQAGVLIPMENNSINAGGVITSAVSSVAHFAAGDVIGGVTAACAAATDFIQPVVGTTAQSGTTISHLGGHSIRAEFWRSSPHYPNRYGKLYCTQTSVNTISGYLKCRDAHWQNNKAFADEIQMVEAYLNGGMFYE